MTARIGRSYALAFCTWGALAWGCSGEMEQEAAPSSLGRATRALTAAERLAACQDDPRVALGLTSAEICAGADIFFRESFDGNGRQCGTCHRAEDNFTISPEFIATLPASDPLFVAEQGVGLGTLEIPEFLRDFALIVENVDGVEDLPNKFTLRSIPHTLSMATSLVPSPGDGSTVPPIQRTGWSGDGAPGEGSLRDFLAGAIFQHYPTDLARVPGVAFREPTSDELDFAEAFQIALGRTNELSLSAVQLSDPGAEAGRLEFLDPANRCNGCHGNAGANNAAGTNRNFDTGVEHLRVPDVDLAAIPRDGGFGGQGLALPDFDSDGDTVPDSFGNGTFNTTPLVEAADTGPFFHTNAFETLEDAIGFYNTSAFNTAPVSVGRPPVAMTPTEINQIGRFLRVLNMALNLQMALQRLAAAEDVVVAFGNSEATIENDLLELAAFELEDAIQVSLGAPGGQLLPQGLQSKLGTARQKALDAVAKVTAPARLADLQVAANFAAEVSQTLGSGLGFTLGSGNLMR